MPYIVDFENVSTVCLGKRPRSRRPRRLYAPRRAITRTNISHLHRQPGNEVTETLPDWAETHRAHARDIFTLPDPRGDSFEVAVSDGLRFYESGPCRQRDVMVSRKSEARSRIQLSEV